MSTILRLVSIAILSIPLRAGMADAAAPSAFKFDPANVRHAGQSGDGTIWAVQNATGGTLLKWDGAKWASLEMVPGSVAKLLATKDGNLYLATKDFDTELSRLYFYTANKGTFTEIPLPDEIKKSTAELELWESPDGRLWLTGNGISIFRYGDEKWECPFALKDATITQDKGGPQNFWCPIRLVFDGERTIWAWSDSQEGGKNGKAIQGLVRFQHGKAEYLKEIPGLPDGPKYFVEKVSDGVAVSVHKKGVYLVSDKSGALQASKIELPDKAEERSVTRIFEARGSLWCVMGASWESRESQEGTYGTLWRREKSGDWKPVIKGLNCFTKRGLPKNPVGVSSEGLWIGADGTGLWFVADDRTVLFDWRVGFPLSSVDRLFQDPATGNILATADFDGSVAFSKADVMELNPPAIPREFQWPIHSSKITQTIDGSIFYAGPGRILYEWRDNDFLPLEFPGQAKDLEDGTLAADSLNRLWIIPEKIDGKAYIYDLSAKKWTGNGIYRDLLAEEAKRSFKFLFRSAVRRSKEAVFGSGKCAAVIGANRRLEFYDGAAWRALAPQDLTTDGSSFHALDRDETSGAILVCIDNRYWMKLGDDLIWQKTDYQRPAKREYLGSMESVEVSGVDLGGLPQPSNERLQTIANADEAWWVPPEGGLWNIKDGAARSWFPAGEFTPFSWRPALRSFLKDRNGNYLLECGRGGTWLVLVPGKPGSFWEGKK